MSSVNIAKLLKCTLCVLLVFAIIVASAVFILDPYCHYRPRSAHRINDPYHCNIGVARTAAYDTVFMGNAAADGFKKDWISSITGGSCVCLPFDCADIDDYDALLTAMLDGDNVKRVFMVLDSSVVSYKSDGCDIPRYLTKFNPLSELIYLFNIKSLVQYFKSDSTEQMTGEYSADNVLRSYDRPDRNITMLDENACKENTDYAVDILLSHIVNNPDTEFIFFVPPYSILYWDKQVLCGNANAVLTSVENACLSLLLCANVKVFYFQNDESVIENLDNYMSIVRYSEDICKYMLESYAQQKHEMTVVTADESFASMWEIVYTFDYESFAEKISE